MAASLLVLASITTAYTGDEKLKMVQNYLKETPQDEVIENAQNFVSQLMADDEFLTNDQKVKMLQDYLEFTPQDEQMENLQNILDNIFADDEE